MTGETQGCYVDYQRAPMSDIARSLGSGFVYQGEPSAFRSSNRGEPSGHLAPTAFINFLQNHDQIGNRALGDRLESAADVRSVEAALAVLLLSPSIPMLFMGEEWGTKAPFPFFCDFGGDLADAVRKGRRIELAWAYEEYGDDVPDALAASTRDSAILDWNERKAPAAHKRLTLVRELLKIRRQEIVPRLANATFGKASADDNRLLTAHWRLGDGATLRLVANLSDQPIRHPPGQSVGTLIWGSELGDSVPPWAVLWRIG
jgi:maltooligosyltrehalose trehalohydrolase